MCASFAVTWTTREQGVRWVWQGHLVFGSGGGTLIREVALDSRYRIAAWRLSLGKRSSSAPVHLDLQAKNKLMSTPS